MKKIICIVMASLLLISMISLYSYSKINNTPQKENSIKYVGSNEINMFRIPIKSISELVNNADLIVIGRIKTDGLTKDVPIQGEVHLEDKTKIQTMKVTETIVAIQKVIYGDLALAGHEILFSQLGIAGSDRLQTKAKKDQTMLLILKKTDRENTYASIDFENGLFVIDTQNVIRSLSDNELTSSYDNQKVSRLETDIVSYFNSLKK